VAASISALVFRPDRQRARFGKRQKEKIAGPASAYINTPSIAKGFDPSRARYLN